MSICDNCLAVFGRGGTHQMASADTHKSWPTQWPCPHELAKKWKSGVFSVEQGDVPFSNAVKCFSCSKGEIRVHRLRSFDIVVLGHLQKRNVEGA